MMNKVVKHLVWAGVLLVGITLGSCNQSDKQLGGSTHTPAQTPAAGLSTPRTAPEQDLHKYDDNGRRLYSLKKAKQGTTRVEYTYNAQGLPEKEDWYAAGADGIRGSSPAYVQQFYSYDTAGRLIKQVELLPETVTHT